MIRRILAAALALFSIAFAYASSTVTVNATASSSSGPMFDVWFGTDADARRFLNAPNSYPGVRMITPAASNAALCATAKARGYMCMTGVGGYAAQWAQGYPLSADVRALYIAIDRYVAAGNTWIYVDEPWPAPASVDPAQDLMDAASMRYNVVGFSAIWNYIHTKHPGVKFGLSQGCCSSPGFHYTILAAAKAAGVQVEDFASYELYNACCQTQNPFVLDGTKAAFPDVLEMDLAYSTESLCGKWPGSAATSGLDIMAGWDTDLYGNWIGPLMDLSFQSNLLTYAATGEVTSFCQLPIAQVASHYWTWKTQTADFTVKVDDFAYQSGGPAVASCDYEVISGANAVKGLDAPGNVTTLPWTPRTCNGDITITIGVSGNCNVSGKSTCLVVTRNKTITGVYGNITYQEYSVSF